MKKKTYNRSSRATRAIIPTMSSRTQVFPSLLTTMLTYGCFFRPGPQPKDKVQRKKKEYVSFYGSRKLSANFPLSGQNEEERMNITELNWEVPEGI